MEIIKKIKELTEFAEDDDILYHMKNFLMNP